MILSRLQLAFADPFTMVWNIGIIVTLGLPLLAYTVARLTSDAYYQQQEEQQQNQEQDQEQYYQNNYDEYGNYVGPTHWWQFWKKSNNNNNEQQQDGEQDQNLSPWWYVWGDQREAEGRDPEDQGKGAIIFIYIWTLLLLMGLVYMANTTNMAAAKLNAFRWALFGFLNYCLVTMILLASLEGGIEVEGRELEEDGWYGQTSVLVFLTCLFGLIQSIVFIAWSGKRIGTKEDLNSQEVEGYVDVGNDEYKSPTAV